MSPRMAWRAIQSEALPKEAIISSDIGNNCAIGNAYPTFEAGPQIPRAGPVRPLRLRPARPSSGAKIACPTRAGGGLCRRRRLRHLHERDDGLGRNEWPPITMVIFRNYQWGAEKRNTTLWYDDNFVGTELDLGVRVRQDRRRPVVLKGVQVRTMDQGLSEALEKPSKAR
jgi:sulfoacetaldehyde acetyltransferase